MSAKFFILYGDNTVTPHISDDAELIAWARRGTPEFDPESYPTPAEKVAAAERFLLTRYKVWGLFEYTPEGMTEFLEAAARGDDLVFVHALEVAQEYVKDAQRALAVAFTEAQQKAMERVQFPIAGDKPAFQKYQERIAEIRELSIKGLYEYIENGDEFPE